MSACISFQSETQVVMLTDGATYDANGILVGFQRKATISRKIPLAVATRGNVGYGEFLAKRIIRTIEIAGFDEGISILEDALPGLLEAVEAAAPVKKAGVEIIVAGVSEDAGPQHLLYLTKPNYGGDFEPLEFTSPGKTWLGVPGARDVHSLADWKVRGPERETAEQWVRAVGVDIMQHYREVVFPADSLCAVDRYCIGGHVDMTVVDAKGARTALLHRWPEDRVGRVIDPFARKAVSQTVVPITSNRRERRAAKRAA